MSTTTRKSAGSVIAGDWVCDPNYGDAYSWVVSSVERIGTRCVKLFNSNGTSRVYAISARIPCADDPTDTRVE